jgi:K(+)-stimulated pyrophosphate-energized sodium pump
VGDNANTPVRIIIALVALAIIVIAVYISKQREVAIGGDEDTPAPPASVDVPPTQPMEPVG